MHGEGEVRLAELSLYRGWRRARFSCPLLGRVHCYEPDGHSIPIRYIHHQHHRMFDYWIFAHAVGEANRSEPCVEISGPDWLRRRLQHVLYF